MAKNEGKKEKKSGISRRDFIKGTGFVVGGAAISSSVLAVACGKPTPPPVTTPPVTTPNGTVTTPPPSANVSTNGTPVIPPPPTAAAAVSELTRFKVNGAPVAVQVEDNETLAHVIRVKLGLIGTKVSCDEGICGFCTLIMDGRSVSACTVLGKEAEGADIMTVESLDNKLYLVQQGFVEESAFQCSFCTSGQIMAARALIERNPNPTRAEVKLAMSGNLCLCSGYEIIADAVLNAAKKARDGVTRPPRPKSTYVTTAGGGA